MKKEYISPEFNKKNIYLNDVLTASKILQHDQEQTVTTAIETVPDEGPDF